MSHLCILLRTYDVTVNCLFSILTVERTNTSYSWGDLTNDDVRYIYSNSRNESVIQDTFRLTDKTKKLERLEAAIASNVKKVWDEASFLVVLDDAIFHAKSLDGAETSMDSSADASSSVEDRATFKTVLGKVAALTCPEANAYWATIPRKERFLRRLDWSRDLVDSATRTQVQHNFFEAKKLKFHHCWSCKSCLLLHPKLQTLVNSIPIPQGELFWNLSKSKRLVRPRTKGTDCTKCASYVEETPTEQAAKTDALEPPKEVPPASEAGGGASEKSLAGSSDATNADAKTAGRAAAAGGSSSAGGTLTVPQSQDAGDGDGKNADQMYAQLLHIGAGGSLLWRFDNLSKDSAAIPGDLISDMTALLKYEKTIIYDETVFDNHLFQFPQTAATMYGITEADLLIVSVDESTGISTQNCLLPFLDMTQVR